MMRFRILWPTVVFAALVVGCSQPEKPASTGTSEKSTVASKTNPQKPSTNPPQEAKPKPQTETKGSKATKPPAPTGKSNRTPSVAPPSASHNWQSSLVSATTIAESTDKMLMSLKNVKVEINYGIVSKDGKSKGRLEQKIGGPTTYSLMYPVLVNDPKRGVVATLAHTRSNGKIISERIGSKTKTRPAASKAPSPPDRMQNWPLLANREIFAGILDGRRPISEYVRGLLDPKNGYTTRVMERTLQSNGRVVRQYRISAQRTVAQSKGLGQSAAELIIDADIYLPVRMIVVIEKPGAKEEDSIAWNASWTNNVKFEPKEFAPIPVAKVNA